MDFTDQEQGCHLKLLIFFFPNQLDFKMLSKKQNLHMKHIYIISLSSFFFF